VSKNIIAVNHEILTNKTTKNEDVLIIEKEKKNKEKKKSLRKYQKRSMIEGESWVTFTQ